MSKNKNLCKWKKEEIEDDFKKLKKIVKEPQFICKKCGRVANDESYLCKSESLK